MRSEAKSGYGQDCPVARTLDIVGERWTLLILRDLLRHAVTSPSRSAIRFR